MDAFRAASAALLRSLLRPPPSPPGLPSPPPRPRLPTARIAGLNMAVFLLIGKTSALTMNVAGVVKDWILILLSYLIYK